MADTDKPLTSEVDSADAASEGSAVKAPDPLDEVSRFIVSTRGRTGFEATMEDPRLAVLGAKYEALPEEDRTYQGRALSWKAVVEGIPDVSQFLAGASSLEEVEPYWINEKGQLIIGDGCPETSAALGLTYAQARKLAMAIPGRRLMSFAEYQRLNAGHNRGRFDLKHQTFVESGEGEYGTVRKASVRLVDSEGKQELLGRSNEVIYSLCHETIGVRCVFETQLNLAG